MKIKLFDLDRGVEVEIEIEREAHPTTIIDKLRAIGLLTHRETAMIGVSLNRKQIWYVPASTVEQLVAYVNQTKQTLCFRRFPIHKPG
ncbi:MAG: hypothetical protein QW610_05485 [Pyrobaculum sp.]